MTKCECGRGEVEYFISATDQNGVLIDRVGLCKECVQGKPIHGALEDIGLKL